MSHLPVVSIGCLQALFFLIVIPATAGEIDFNRDIRPILSDTCFACHGPDSQQRVSEMRLDDPADILRVTESGAIVAPGDAAASLLFQRVTSEDPDLVMPPPDSGRKLSPAQIALIGQWITEGAAWESHWAFVPPSSPELPPVHNPTWCQNPIDRFVLKRIEQSGMTPSAPATRETLIRRVTLDLTGLPPTESEVESFVSDASPAAWERVVDRLLQSPRYGEHLAVMWLDSARYADTSGYQSDGPREMWRWRDWVIDAYNANMPFDQFTIEQIAGDLLPNASLNQRIATGFNRNHRGNSEGGIVPEEYQVEYVADRVDTTCTVWLGLTMGCARCHDHKYDPLSQKDFYRFFAFFNNIPEDGRALKEGNSPPYIQAPTADMQHELERLDERVRSAQNALKRLTAQRKRRQQEWEEQAPTEPMDPDWTLTDGLLNQFRLDGNLRDERNPRAEPPHLSAAEFEPRLGGQALRLSGSQFTEVGDAGNFGYFDAFSIAAWIKPSAPSGTILSRMVPVEEGSGYYLHLQDCKLQINLVKRWLDDSIRVVSSDPLPLDRWQHLLVSYDGSRRASGVRAYWDGRPLELQVVYDGINQSFAVDEPLRLGGGHGFLPGVVDDVQIYNRVLSVAEAAILSVPESIQALRDTAQPHRSPAQTDKLTRYFIERHAPERIRNADRESTSAQRERDRFYHSIPTVMVMQEMATPRKTHVLKRGQYDAPGEQVTPDTPAALPPLPADSPPNRLDLAQWIASADNPLTARVAVNRIWQMHFGTGLVRTTEDFGSQGEMPTHPLLLDYLANEFVNSGWDLKALHRLIVSSATYQQSSLSSAKLQEWDPENRWLARGPRLRLSAEMVRDQALFVGGLLDKRLGGPSVRPYQPEGLWKEIASTTSYEQSQGGDLYRRSLYTYWKRTVAPPTMVTFDASARESCTVKRTRTNTPLQALAMMNETTFVESARALALRVLQSKPPSDAKGIATAFRRITNRLPTPAESDVLQHALQSYREEFLSSPEQAQQLLSVGDSRFSSTLQAPEHAAWTTLMSLILNLDEVVNKE